MRIQRNMLAAFTAAVLVFSIKTVHADSVIPVDLSANVVESIVPGGTVFHNSAPLFGATFDPKQTAQLLYSSPVGVNASGRSTNISGAFASSLAESDGNGGVGVSQLIFGSPGGSGDGVRQLFAQSLWTHTVLYDGPAAHDVLHLNIPTLQVGLLGVPPRRTGLSATETAEADAKVVEVVTHPDGSMTQGLFEFGIREFETQVPSGSDLLNLVDMEILESPNPLVFTPTLRFNGDDFNPSYTLDPVSLDLALHDIQAGDIVSWVYTLTAEGTTHGFERGYYAFLGDPFGGEPVSGNLSETIALVDQSQPGTGGGTSAPGTGAEVPEPGTGAFMLLGLAGFLMWRWREAISVRTPRLKA
jgi:hypothetical protein